MLCLISRLVPGGPHAGVDGSSKAGVVAGQAAVASPQNSLAHRGEGTLEMSFLVWERK